MKTLHAVKSLAIFTILILHYPGFSQDESKNEQVNYSILENHPEPPEKEPLTVTTIPTPDNVLFVKFLNR
tara:strand:+ start:655 stop:864 length:210 start_codon:yes stop_codon:yes gene_type:complete